MSTPRPSVSPAIVERIWRRDATVWGAEPDSDVGRAIANRLGWLDVPTGMQAELPRVEALAEGVRRDGIRVAYLLGMGGSSLCAEVMRSVYGVRDGYPELVVMDTTDEAAIAGALARLEPAETLFLVSSKSGGTIEPASMEKLYFGAVERALGGKAGRQFVAVTDPGTALAQLGQQRGYRGVFLNPPDIGGRFSALTLFGLVPGALVGAPVRDMLSGGADMAEGCRQSTPQNAGFELGAFFGTAVRAGRDKLTVVLPRPLHALGLWIEQLVAESTGKHGTGALPVVDEPLGRPDEYGNDRCFVAVSTEHEGPDPSRLDALEAAGHPVLRLRTREAMLGAEFFRWEFAIAVAGSILEINPFDEPNVQEAKDKTKAILAQGDLSGGTPAAATHGVSAFSRFTGGSPSDVVKAALSSLKPRDYVAFLSYLPAEPAIEQAIAEIRERIRSRFKVATTFGVGPRYLHSTGQYHKGGPNTALAFVITGEDATNTAIPGAPYTFSQLKRAQAVGDFQTLEAHGRRAVRIHLDRGIDPISGLRTLFADAMK
ncbi:MAG: glucose-6-phosphate isomerase [Vicinamibacterales bacterium]